MKALFNYYQVNWLLEGTGEFLCAPGQKEGVKLCTSFAWQLF
jgi:hypothetical protein